MPSGSAPSYSDPAQKAARLYARSDLEGAIAVLDQASSERPADPQLHFMLANALYRVGRWESAARSYKIAAKLRPNHPDSWLGLGHTLYQSGKFKEAGDAWNRAAQLTPGDALPLLAASLGYLQQGETRQAQHMLHRAIRVDAQWKKRLVIDIRWTPEMVAALEKLQHSEQAQPVFISEGNHP